MQLLIQFLYQFVAPAVAWFTAQFGKKVGLTILIIGAFTAAYATFSAAVWAAMSGVALTLPAEYRALFFFLPDNANNLIGIAVTVDMAIMFYKYIKRMLDIKAKT